MSPLRFFSLQSMLLADAARMVRSAKAALRWIWPMPGMVTPGLGVLN